MKKLIAVIISLVLLLSLVPAAVAVAKSPKTEFDLNGPHFNLNLIGKADGWNDKEVNNPDRHTMFVPMDTTEWEIELKQPNKVFDHGSKVGDNVTEFQNSFAIYMTQDGSDEFKVVDGTAFDGDACELNLADGKYYVVVAAKAKPVSKQPDIDGWAQIYDNNGALYYYLNLGTVSVKRSWSNATDLFFIDTEEASIGETGLPDPGDTQQGGDHGAAGMWIFDYFKWLTSLGGYGDYAYFWQLKNYGTKLIQVRFYPMT